jgi:sugar phosphate isomerase/epimerase
MGSLAPRPKAAARLVDCVPGLTLTLDYTHFTRMGLPDAAVEPLVQHASHFHARGARRGRLQESFSCNTIDYRQVHRAMQRSG